MSATYGTCALQFPSSYVVMDAEEMEYLDGGAASSKMLVDNLTGLWYSCSQASRALRMGGYSLGYIASLAKMSYPVIAGSIAVKLGATLGTINIALGVIAAVGAAGATYYLATNRVFY